MGGTRTKGRKRIPPGRRWEGARERGCVCEGRPLGPAQAGSQAQLFVSGLPRYHGSSAGGEGESKSASCGEGRGAEGEPGRTRVAGLPIFSQELFLAWPLPLWPRISALGEAASSKGLNVSGSYSPALPPLFSRPPTLGTPPPENSSQPSATGFGYPHPGTCRMGQMS